MLPDKSFENANYAVSELVRRMDACGLRDDANRCRGLVVTSTHSAGIALAAISRMPAFADESIDELRRITIRVLRYTLRPRRAAPQAA